jgi:DNA primase
MRQRGLSAGGCNMYLSRNIGEATPEKPKYRFPEGLHKGLELFGARQLRERAPLRIIYLVESPFSVMKFHQLGFPAVSPFGAYLTVGQAKILRELARGVVYLPDRDKRGQVSESIQMLSAWCWVKSPTLPEGVDDPEKLTEEQVRSLT